VLGAVAPGFRLNGTGALTFLRARCGVRGLATQPP
jgi:hypothetical protein